MTQGGDPSLAPVPPVRASTPVEIDNLDRSKLESLALWHLNHFAHSLGPRPFPFQVADSLWHEHQQTEERVKAGRALTEAERAKERRYSECLAMFHQVQGTVFAFFPECHLRVANPNGTTCNPHPKVFGAKADSNSEEDDKNFLKGFIGSMQRLSDAALQACRAADTAETRVPQSASGAPPFGRQPAPAR
jgi:hypothetical protein